MQTPTQTISAEPAFQVETPLLLRSTLKFALLAALLLSAEYWCLGPYSYLRTHDNADSFVPRSVYALHSLMTEGPSHWLPSVAGGVDRLSQDLEYTHVSSFFYLFLPAWAAYGTLMFLQSFFSVFGTLLIARGVLALPAIAAGFASLLFPMYILGFQYMELGLYVFPLVIWFLTQLESRNYSSTRAYVLAALSGLLYGMASSLPITMLFGGILMLFWFAVVAPQRTARFWQLFFLFNVVSLFPHIAEIWALLLNTPESLRAGRHFNGLEGVWETLTLPARGLWILGVWVLGIGVVLLRMRAKKFLLIAGTFCFCWFGYILLNLAKFYSARYSLLNGFQIDRFYEFAPFFGSLGAGLVLQEAIATYRKPLRFTGQQWLLRSPYASLALVTVIGLFLLNKYEHLKKAVMEGNVAAYNFKASAFRKLDFEAPANPRSPFRVASIGVDAGFANFHDFETIDGDLNLYPMRFKLFWAQVIEPRRLADPVIRKYFDDWGHRIYLFAQSGNSVAIGEMCRLDLLSLANVKYVIASRPISGSNLELMQRGRQYNVSAREALAERFKGRSDLFVYRNPDCLPRAFIVHRIRFNRDLNELNRALGSEKLACLREEVLLEDKYNKYQAEVPDGNSEDHVEWLRYGSDWLEVRAATGHPGMLIVTNSYSKFWNAVVDNNPSEIVPAYGTFWGIPLGSGRHHVTLRYKPPYSEIP